MKYALSVLLYGTVASIASADFTPLTQDRYVRTVYQGAKGTTENRIDAPDMLPFDGALGDDDSGAQQHSVIGTHSVNGTMFTGAFWAGLDADFEAQSVCNVTFLLTQATSYEATLHREANVFPDSYDLFFLRLRDSSNQLVVNLTLGEPDQGNLTRFSSGVLAAGQYQLEVFSRAHASGPGSAEYRANTGDFSFVVPAPASVGTIGLGLVFAGRRRRPACR